MKIRGFDNELHPGITMHKIPVKAGFAGLVFTIGMMAVSLIGIPALIYFFLLAIVLGIVVAVMLRFIPRLAGFVAFVLTAVMLVGLVGIPSMDDWRREQEKDRKDLYPSVLIPPPPPQYELSAFQGDCSQCQSNQLCDRTTQRDRGQRGPQPQSRFDGTWNGSINDLPGVTLIVADAGGGQLGGLVTFCFQMRDNEHSAWRVAGKYVAPLLAARTEGKVLVFEVQHHKTHGSREFGPNVTFRMELTGDNQALLYNLSDTSTGPVKLTRQE